MKLKKPAYNEYWGRKFGRKFSNSLFLKSDIQRVLQLFRLFVKKDEKAVKHAVYSKLKMRNSNIQGILQIFRLFPPYIRI